MKLDEPTGITIITESGIEVIFANIEEIEQSEYIGIRVLVLYGKSGSVAEFYNSQGWFIYTEGFQNGI